MVAPQQAACIVYRCEDKLLQEAALPANLVKTKGDVNVNVSLGRFIN